MPQTPLEAWAFGARRLLQNCPLTLTTKPSTSKLSTTLSCVSTFHDIPQMESLLAGYPLNRGSIVVMFQ